MIGLEKLPQITGKIQRAAKKMNLKSKTFDI